MSGAKFSPQDVHLHYCGGAHKRFETVCQLGEWWWELGGDWGLGILDGIVLSRLPLTVSMRFDLSEPGAGGVSWSWVSDVWPRRLGDDGLPFDQRVQLSIHVGRDAIQVSGEGVEMTLRQELTDGRLTAGPKTLECQLHSGDFQLALDGQSIVKGAMKPLQPGMMCLSAGANACRESRARIGEIGLWEW